MEKALLSLLTQLYCEATNCINRDEASQLPETIMRMISPVLESAFKLDLVKAKLPIKPIHGVILNAQEYQKKLENKDFWRQT